jgi:hypothetical protein
MTDGTERTPDGTCTPATMADDGPTIRGIGLTAPRDIRKDSLITAVYCSCENHVIQLAFEGQLPDKATFQGPRSPFSRQCQAMPAAVLESRSHRSACC